MADESFIEKKESLNSKKKPLEFFDIEKSEQPISEITNSKEQHIIQRQEFNQEVSEQNEIPKTEEHVIEKDIDSTIDILKKKLRKKKKKNTKIPLIKDEMTMRIEKVMEEGIADAYRELTPIQKQEFKIKGEETAYKIREIMKKTHIKIKVIFKLLYEWLKMLPGINKFFLEQEAKIKADKIISIKDVSDFK